MILFDYKLLNSLKLKILKAYILVFNLEKSLIVSGIFTDPGIQYGSASQQTVGKNVLFGPKECKIGSFQGVIPALFDSTSDTCRGPTPTDQPSAAKTNRR
jgi:hypothetical protein